MFSNPDDSHAHSLQTLDVLYGYDDFMSSIHTVIDLGCGPGKDLEWWATRTTRDTTPLPLNIHCTGIDLFSQHPLARKYANAVYHSMDFEKDLPTPGKRKYDVLWCHDAFQYVIHPLETLKKWHNIASDGGMLALVVPQTTNLCNRSLDIIQLNGCYYHYTLVNLIHLLAVSGWNCASGFFLKRIDDPWLSIIVYKSEQGPLDPKNTSWYELCDRGLLPESVVKSVQKHGGVRQEELVLPWLDKSLTWYGKQ